MEIDEGLSFGIDLGIGSCGWAVIDNDKEAIIDMGVWLFPVPETDKERTPTNQIRRSNRLMRRVTRRRAKRKKDIRTLCRSHGLIDDAAPTAFPDAGVDPWALRAEGLDRLLTGRELATVLLHIARHRGFKSNSKRDRGSNADPDSSKMLAAIGKMQERLAQWRSVGEMVARADDYKDRKRNRDGDYSRSLQRDDQKQEIALLFDRQRRLGNTLATEELERAYTDTAFFQRPIRDSEDRVGQCRFLPGEPRAPLRSYSFEQFRLLSGLAHLRLRSGRAERALTPEEIATAAGDLGRHAGLNFSRLRKQLALGDDWRFAGIKPEEEGKRDVVARSGGASPGCYALRTLLGDGPWRALLARTGVLDDIARILSFREDLGSIRAGLAGLGLEPLTLDKLMEGVEQGAFGDFKRAGHLSAAACRAIIPHLARGLVYSAACKAAGFDHTAGVAKTLDDIANPIVRRAVGEALKQVKTLIHHYGRPARIHIELARDLGKSQEERDEIRRGIEKRTQTKDRLRDEYQTVTGRPCAGAEDLLRYELWKEQNGRCLYTDQPIPPSALVAADNSVQVDHILPWSRSGDDSFINKTLCLIEANQAKRGRTPFEWFDADKTEAEWQAYAARVESLKTMKGRKKRNLLLKDASELEEGFRSRNLNDTRYACRLLLGFLGADYPQDGKRYVFARPGPLTDRLRRAWGVQDLKKTPDGERINDDRHHALDALIVAATSESALNRLTCAFQEAERRGAPRDFADYPPPWPGFVAQARAGFARVFVARSEKHRARGEGHAATIRQIVDRDGRQEVYERKAVDALTLKDLDRVKDAERNHRLIENLRLWIEAGKPKDRPPQSPKGDPIRKVRLLTNKKVDVEVRDGAAERGEMVRVDVFRKANRKGVAEFFLVPVYPHQVMDPAGWPQPPNKAIQAGKEETNWPEIGPEHEFLFSLRQNSFVCLVKPDGEVIEGYFRGADRNTGAVIVSEHHCRDKIRKGIGARTLRSIQKFHIDRLGRRHEIEREQRTWHGVACI